MRQAGAALNWCVAEMERRYKLMSALSVRNLASYNQKVREGLEKKQPVKHPFTLTPDNPEDLERLPLLVVVIDNDGGGIFSFLPQAEVVDPGRFELLYGTPHGLDLTAVG